MGSRGSRNRNNDPFYDPGVAPLGTTGPYDPAVATVPVDPNQEYIYETVPGTSLTNYGGGVQPGPNIFGGRYTRGLNQIPGVLPWNYGNYYLGNTTMQMMPFMINKVRQYELMQALGGTGLLGGSMPMMPFAPCCVPPPPCCLPASYSMPMSAPMMAAATPLPIAFNPLIQGMYPMASMNPVSWMAPSSFMSAITSGPMPYRPPGYDFPSNVGMVMTIPYGTPNPLFSSGYSGSNISNSYYYSYSSPPALPPAAPMVHQYPSITYSASAPVYQGAPMSAPPSVAPVQNQPLPVGVNFSLMPSEGVITQNSSVQPSVMTVSSYPPAASGSNVQSSQEIDYRLPIYNATSHSTGPQVVTSVQDLSVNNITQSEAKNPSLSSHTYDTLGDRLRRYLPSFSRRSRSSYSFVSNSARSDPALPPIRYGQLISDSGWMPKNNGLQTIPSVSRHKKVRRPLYTDEHGRSVPHPNDVRVSFFPHKRRRGRSNSSVSEYDCEICAQRRDRRRIGNYLGKANLSSLLSSSKGSDRRSRSLSPHNAALSTTSRASSSSAKRKTMMEEEQASLPQQTFDTVVVEEEDEESDSEENQSKSEKRNLLGSQISLRTLDE